MEELVVTGGLGFIGSNFIHHIIGSRGDLRVTNVDYGGLGSNIANVKDLRRHPRYRFIKADLANPSIFKRVFRKADFVVNFAAETHVDRSIANPEPFVRSNILGAFNVLEAARRFPVQKLVHISTDEVYGSARSGSFNEESPLNPSSPYSATKAGADLLARAWRTTYKLPIVTLRCTNNFGPYQHPEKFIPKTIIRALNGMNIPLYGGGAQVRDWIFVRDFCSATEKALEEGTPGETYNVSAGNELTNREVAKRVLHLLERPAVKLVKTKDRPGHDYRYSLSSKKARRHLSWQPAYSLDEALLLTVKWYMENRFWWKPLATAKVLSDIPWKEKW